MKKRRQVDKVINSFYLRNVILYLVLFSQLIARRTLAFNFNAPGFWMNSVTFASMYLVAMLHNLVFYEKLFKRRKYVLYGLALAGSLAVLNECLLPVIRPAFGFLLGPETAIERILIYYDLLANVYSGFAIYLAFTYFKEREDKLKIENLARQVELKQLKEQLNPHFLFNALNNIYSYTLEHSRRANELILMLSELMRFIIENADKDTIPVSQEIFFAEHYIAFEKERLGNRCNVRFSKSVSDGDIPIAPFILFTFIENAFKHGTASVDKTEIEIDINVDAQETKLYIKNAIRKAITSSTQTGLANTRRRINLIYPQRHSLALITEDGNFITQLCITNGLQQ